MPILQQTLETRRFETRRVRRRVTMVDHSRLRIFLETKLNLWMMSNYNGPSKMYNDQVVYAVAMYCRRVKLIFSKLHQQPFVVELDLRGM